MTYGRELSISFYIVVAERSNVSLSMCSAFKGLVLNSCPKQEMHVVMICEMNLGMSYDMKIYIICSLVRKKCTQNVGWMTY